MLVGKTEQSDRGEVSKSQLILDPLPEQDGQLITCRLYKLYQIILNPIPEQNSQLITCKFYMLY